MNIYYRYERVFLSFWSVILFLSLPVLSTFGSVIGSAYDFNSWKNDLYTIDPKTGNVSFLNSLDIENGDFIWRLSVMDSIAYFQSSSNTLHGIDITTGTIVSSVLVSPMQAIVSGVNGLLIGVDYNSTTQQNQISSINPRTGSTIVLSSFSFDTGWWNGNLVRVGGSLIAQSTSGTLYRFDINSGEMLSTTLGLSPFQSIVASEEGTLVGILYNQSTDENELYSVVPTLGVQSLLNSFRFDSGGWKGALAYANGSIFAPSSAGTLYEFDFRTGVIKSERPGLPRFEILSSCLMELESVPEPTSMAIFGLGALGMAYRARRKAKA